MVIERVRQIQEEMARQKAKEAREEAAEEVLLLKQADEERRVRQEDERKRQLEIEKRMRIMKVKYDALVTESGLLEGLEEIKQDLLRKKTRKVVLLSDHDLDTGTLHLLWGNAFELEGREVKFDEHGQKDYYEVEVDINLKSGDLTFDPSSPNRIGTKIINGDHWRADSSLVVDMLARMYLDPVGHSVTYYPYIEPTPLR